MTADELPALLFCHRPADGARFDADTRNPGFLELNDKREQADYDHGSVFPRRDTRTHIALAQRVVTVVNDARDQAGCFSG
jgi:hypothetical protein